jgi:hypothetical protein
MKLCRGDGPSSHPQIAFDDATERGVCPLCKAAANERYMKDTLICFSNGLIDVGTIFSRLANAGLFLPIPASARENPLLAMKMTREVKP